MQKFEDLNLKKKEIYRLLCIFQTDGLIDGLYAIKCPMIHWIIGKMFAKNQALNSRDEKVKRLSLFQNRQTDIVAYRGAKFSQKGCPMVHWIM